MFATSNYSHPIIPFFALFIALWSIVMLEYWKREEKYTAMKWGMIDFEEEQVDRPQFQGDIIKSYIDGSTMRYFSPRTHAYRIKQSIVIIIIMACIVISAVVSIYVMRYYLYMSYLKSYAQYIASIVNSVQITIFNIIYENVAVQLTDMENHRYLTNTTYVRYLHTYLYICINNNIINTKILLF